MIAIEETRQEERTETIDLMLGTIATAAVRIHKGVGDHWSASATLILSIGHVECPLCLAEVTDLKLFVTRIESLLQGKDTIITADGVDKDLALVREIASKIEPRRRIHHRKSPLMGLRNKRIQARNRIRKGLLPSNRDQLIAEIVLLKDDDKKGYAEIAADLNARGSRTARGNEWTGPNIRYHYTTYRPFLDDAPASPGEETDTPDE